jgi:hypothetical protein
MGLIAAWREGLLAQKVLKGETKGYRNHPQLLRFRAAAEPVAAVGVYLWCVAGEAAARAYSFDTGKIAVAATKGAADAAAATTAIKGSGAKRGRIPVTAGQVAYETALLKRKLTLRDPDRLTALCDIEMPRLNDAFREVPGDIEAWEKIIPEVLADLS